MPDKLEVKTRTSRSVVGSIQGIRTAVFIILYNKIRQ